MDSLKKAIGEFLTSGAVSNEMLVAYDQTGRKIPGKEIPYWEPEEFIGEMEEIPEGEIWEEILPTLPDPPRFHDNLPDEIPLERIIKKDPQGNPHFLGTFFTENESAVEIPFDSIQGFVLAPQTTELDAPRLKSVGLDILAFGVKKARTPELQRVGGQIQMDQAQTWEAPKLTQVGDTMRLMMLEKADFPELETAGEMAMPSAAHVNMPKLVQCGGIMALGSKKVDLSSLRTITEDLDLDFSKKITAPVLEKVGGNLYTSSDKSFQPKGLKVGGTWDKWTKEGPHWPDPSEMDDI